MLVVLVAGFGCATTLETGGPYDGDTILFRSEQAIVETKDAMDDFLKWEEQNQVVLARYPEVKKYADEIRRGGRSWITSAQKLRDTYVQNPTETNRTKLQTSLALLRTALAEIAVHLARSTETPIN